MNIAKYLDPYQFVCDFTTGDTAPALQAAPISYSDMMALEGIFALGDADAAEFIFACTNGATTLQLLMTGFQPIGGLDASGLGRAFDAMLERPLSGVALSAMANGATPRTWGAVANAVVPQIPSAAELINSFTAFTLPSPYCVPYSATASGVGSVYVGSHSSGASAALMPGALGFSHIRVQLSCATAAKSVYCAGRRLYHPTRRRGV